MFSKKICVSRQTFADSKIFKKFSIHSFSLLDGKRIFSQHVQKSLMFIE